MSDVARPRRSASLRGRARGLLALALLPAAAVAAEPLSGVPFAPPSRPAGATRFTLLPPEQTGLVAANDYADPAMWLERYLEFTTGSIGTGVAIGDYDNDGRPDVFVVNKTGPSRLFRNLGGWRFEDVTAATGLEPETPGAIGQAFAWLKRQVSDAPASGGDVSHWKQGAAFADVNNDGWLDLYVCRFGVPNQLWMNQGDGTFAEEAAARGLALVDASGMGAFCDFDRDGWLDVFVQTNLLDAARQPGGRPDYLLRNRGDGTFVDVTAAAGLAGPTLAHSATWWDFDHDGWPDLYLANDFAGPDRLYRNNRDGTFTDVIHQSVARMPYSAMGADLGDVNNDGWIDFTVADMAATSHEKDQRGMALSRELGRDDDDSLTTVPQVLHSTLYLAAGPGLLLEAATLAGIQATDWTWSVRFEDLDNDGRIDLHVTNGMNREYQNTDLRARVVTSENAFERLRLMKDSAPLHEHNLVYQNLGDLTFREVGREWGLDQFGISYGAAFGDLDGDGDLDLVFANHEAPPTLLRNDSVDGHRLIVALRGTRSNRFGVGATVKLETASGRQVRQLVLARGYLSTSEPVLHFGLGHDERVVRLSVEWPSGHRQEFQDLAADRRYTINEPAGPAAPADPPAPAAGWFADVTEELGLALRVEENFEPEPQPLVPVRFDRRGPALAAGDLDGDGTDDLVLGGTGRQPAQVWLAREGRFTAGAALPLVRVDDGPLLLFEADGDGRLDLLQTRLGSTRPGVADYQPVLHLGQGDGTFVPARTALPEMPWSIGAAATADFDRDGRLDLFLGGRNVPGQYPQAPRSALLMNRGGKFEDVTKTLAPALLEPGLVSAALATDVDGDGWLDLLLALEWGGVRYFRNEDGRGFTDRSEPAGFAAAGHGWWTSLAAGDFNGDGRLDYVAGNVGLNTPYRPPARLYTGRFGQGNAVQLIEAHLETGRLLPRRTLRALGGQIPALRRRYARNDDYARATLEEILGAERLAEAQRWEAGELRSGVFLSDAQGNRRFSPLPRVAQIAPFQGLLAQDFDGDGHLDVCVVQNSHAPIPSVGRFTGGLGLLLRGNDRGDLEPVMPGESGLVVPGDAKALVAIDPDADGWLELVATRNSAPALAWASRPAADRRTLRIVLAGPAGNPTAIGARLELELADGSRRVREVQPVQGMISQSTSVPVFAYPAGMAPRRLNVRWPDGRQSEATWTGPVPATVRLHAP